MTAVSRSYITNDCRHSLYPGKFTGVFTAMSRYDFVFTVFQRTDDRRNENTIFSDAFNCFFHGIIITDFKRMIGEWMKRGYRNLNYGFILLLLIRCYMCITYLGVRLKIKYVSILKGHPVMRCPLNQWWYVFNK